MANSFTQFWSKDRCEQIEKFARAETPLTVLFGGPHQSGPNFQRFGVRPGDYVYPIRVTEGVIYVLGRMKVRQLLSIEEYVTENAATFAGFESDWGAAWTLENWRNAHPEMRFLVPMCVNEAALGEEGTPLRLDVAIPPDMLERLRFCSAVRERGLKHIVEGRLKSSVGLQGGTYRLSKASAKEVEALLLIALASSGNSLNSRTA